MRASSLPRRLIEALERRLAARRRSGPPPRWVVAAVVVALAVGAVAAFRSLPDDLGGFRWWPIAVMVALTPPGIALNGYEYAISARISGARVKFVEALRVALYGTAANLLPLPGASLVRIEAMRRSGARLTRATAVTAAVGFCWLGLSLLAAGLLLLPRGLVSVPFVGAGVVCMVGVWLVLRRGRDLATALGDLGRISLVEAGFVLSTAAKLGLALAALGASPSPATAFTLGVSSTVAAATGFLPGGLGLREAIAAALGPLVGVEPSTAFLAAVIDRVVSLSVVAIAAAIVLNTGRSPAELTDSADALEG